MNFGNRCEEPTISIKVPPEDPTSLLSRAQSYISVPCEPTGLYAYFGDYAEFTFFFVILIISLLTFTFVNRTFKK